MRESNGNRDGESEAISKVISSLNAVYLFINERKVFSEPRRGKHHRSVKRSLSEWVTTDTIQRLFLRSIISRR